MEPLSKYLGHYIDELEESLTASQLATDAIDREKLMESVEGLFGNATSSPFTRYHLMRKLYAKFPVLAEEAKFDREMLEIDFDDCLSRLLLSEIPRMVSRALQLEPILIEKCAPADQNAYLREATRCYLYGLFNASVALSRSALELALSRKMPIMLQRAPGEKKLKDIISIARSSILKTAPEMSDRADEIRDRANAVVHGKTCKGPEALRVLGDTRSVIGYLYGKNR